MTIADPVPPVIAEAPKARPWPAFRSGIGIFALVLLLGIGGWLFAPSQMASIQPPTNVDELARIDGVLVEVDLPRLVLDAFRPLDGAREIQFRVRERDLRYFDVVHLRAHSSIGLPTRLFYEREGDVYWAVYKEDAPANSSGDGA